MCTPLHRKQIDSEDNDNNKSMLHKFYLETRVRLLTVEYIKGNTNRSLVPMQAYVNPVFCSSVCIESIPSVYYQ